MTEPTAEKTLKMMNTIGHQLAESIGFVEETESKDDVKQYINTVSEILSTILLQVINPICLEHPHLTPKELKSRIPWPKEEK